MKIFGLNIDKNKLGGAFKNLPKKKDLETKPSRDWAFVVCGFFVLVIIIGLTNYFFYKKAVSKIEQEEVSASNENFDKNQVSKVLDFFDKRSEEFNKDLAAPSEIKDPSI